MRCSWSGLRISALSWPTSGFTHKPVATPTTHTHTHTPPPTPHLHTHTPPHPNHPPTRPTPTLLVLIQLPSPSNPRPQLLPLPRPPFHPILTLPDFSDSTPKLSTQSVNAPSPHTHQPLTWSCYYCLLLLPTPLQPCRLLFKLAYVCFMATPSTLSDKGTCGRFCWVPRHCGMEGNEIVDQLARKTLDHDLDLLATVHYADFKPLVSS